MNKGVKEIGRGLGPVAEIGVEIQPIVFGLAINLTDHEGISVAAHAFVLWCRSPSYRI